MAHVRQQIRDQIVTALTGLTTTGSNVFRSRIFPLEQTKLPALCIFTKSEATEFDTITINAVAYTMRIVQDDGTGMTTLVLEKQ